MPGYNAEKTLEKTVSAIPKGLAYKIILTDDCSHDKTSAIGRKLGLIVHRNKINIGYGGSQKIGYKLALKYKPDIVLMLHPDFQYDPKLAYNMVKPIEGGLVDVMLGTRIRSRAEALKGGMPIYKYLFNRLLTMIENIVLGLNLSEYHTGYRAYSRKVLETVPFNKFSDDFVFDSQFLVSAAYSKFRFGETPVAVRYFSEASSISFKRSLMYGVNTLLTLGKYLCQKMGLIRWKIFS